MKETEEKIRCLSTHIWRGVRVLFLLIGMCSLQAFAQNKESLIRINEDSIALSDLLWKVHEESGCEFIYCAEDLEHYDNLSIDKEGTVAELLDVIFEETTLKYALQDDIYIISSATAVSLSESQNPQSEQMRIIGRVTDVDGAVLPGVSVMIKGTGLGVATTIEGRFSITLEKGNKSTLIFSFIGMKTQEVEIKNGAPLNIVLLPDEFAVNEVVIQGAYGAKHKREDMVSSAYQLSSKTIENVPVARIDKLLEGFVPGVTISEQSSTMGSTTTRNSVRIRGEASLSASNEPLWIVDGVPLYTGDRTNQISGLNTSVSPLSYIAPEDIESITVLKDASATSIYGANGANGVILITTKKGKKGAARFTFSADYGISKINEQTKFKVLNAKQYLELSQEAFVNAGNRLEDYPYSDNELNTYSETSTDWYDEFYGIGATTQLGLSASGASDKSSYYVSGNYYLTKPTLKGNEQKRYSLRITNDWKFSDKIRFSLTMAGSHNENDFFRADRDYYETLPIFSPYNEDGTYRLYNRYLDSRAADGSAIWYDRKMYNRSAERAYNVAEMTTTTVNTNAFFEYEILPDLKYSTRLGLDYQQGNEESYKSTKTWSGMRFNGEPYGDLSKWTSTFFNWNNVHRLNYELQFDKHKFATLLAFEARSKKRKSISATGSGFANDNIREVSYANVRKGSSSSSLQNELSYFGQLSYSYDRRYYLVVNARRDGNSSFGKDVKWANFASVGGSWNIHNEAFFESELIDVLKLKASYGSSGNSRIGSIEALGVYKYSDDIRYNGKSGTTLLSCPNPGLSWETTYMFNTGVRMKFKKRFEFALEYYSNKTVDLLTKLDVSRTTGDTRVYRNVGVIQNEGIELTITTKNIDSELKWTTDFNISNNRNKLVELYNGTQKNFGHKLWAEGKDTQTFYLVRWAGVDPRDGAPMWYDKAGNITRTYNLNDRVADKSANPIFTGGIINTLSYRGFSIRVMTDFKYKGYAFSVFERGTSSDGLNIFDENQNVNQLDRWQKPGDMALSPKPYWELSTKSTMNSTRYLHDMTFFRLKNVSMQYHFPKRIPNYLKMTSLKLSFTVDNIGVWTPYNKKGVNSYRNMMSGRPLERTYMLGIDIGF